MRLTILGYLQVETNTENVWVNIQDLYNGINITDNDLFEKSLVDMLDSGEIRHGESKGFIQIALESNIKKILNDRRLTAIEELNEKLRISILDEDYEKANEWQELLNKYK